MNGANLVILVYMLSALATGTAEPLHRTGTIVGQVTTVGGALPEMIVYLECVDPHRRFPAPSEPAVISQKGARFTPSLLVVPVGQAVDFRNDENRPIEHNVFSRSPAKPFDLGLYRPPEGKLVVFDAPGPVRLFCSIHRYMDGMIFVSPTPFFARVESDGSFRIADVPAGEYRLRTWQRNLRFNEQEVAVRVGDSSQSQVKVEMKRG